MTPILEETITVDFVTSSATGAAVDADSTPTVEVFEDATDTAILAPIPVKRTGKTGNYRIPIACSAANGFELNKSYNVVVSATVGGVAAKAVAARFQVRAAPIAASDVWASGTRTLTGFGFSVTVGTNNDKSGYLLAAAGLDAITVETGVNARQAFSPILAAAAGVLSGADTGSIVIKGGNVATTRIAATTDASGNRSSVTLTLPT